MVVYHAEMSEGEIERMSERERVFEKKLRERELTVISSTLNSCSSGIRDSLSP